MAAPIMSLAVIDRLNIIAYSLQLKATCFDFCAIACCLQVNQYDSFVLRSCHKKCLYY